MSWRLFLDECLSPSLVGMAIDAGFEATCSRDRGLLGAKDRQLMTSIINNDYTFVTRNARDFRGKGANSPSGLYASQEVHSGLICLNSNFVMTVERQQYLFSCVLRELAQRTDLTNQVLEVFEQERRVITLISYDLCRPSG
ncbi:hypothetical protein GTP69_30045 [Duganella sp. CY42W]|uniref:DUF5615 domain-containing protein n=2 Tax=Duganella levis TaxID=2692169 RepID=A0ABW9W968_9BURK|nr:hypothetical protein [Duganella levis]